MPSDHRKTNGSTPFKRNGLRNWPFGHRWWRFFIPTDTIKKYDANATVALLSIVMKRNLFPWFNEHGIPVDQAKAPFPLGAVNN